MQRSSASAHYRPRCSHSAEARVQPTSASRLTLTRLTLSRLTLGKRSCRMPGQLSCGDSIMPAAASPIKAASRGGWQHSYAPFLPEKNLVFAFFPRVAVDIGQAQRGKETLILRSKITRGPPNPSSLAIEMARSPGESCSFNSRARPNSRHTAKSDCRPSKSPTCSADRRNR
jgi:hypothetical protein